MVKNDKIDALIMLSGNVLIQNNIEFYKSIDTSNTSRPKSLDRRVYRNINKENRKKEFGTFYKYAKRFVAAIIIVCTLSFAIVMAVEPLREALWSVIVEFFDDYMTITYVTQTQPPTAIEDIKNINPRRKDWEKQVVMQSETMYCVVYIENGAKVLSFSQMVFDKNESWLDNENNIVEDAKVGKNRALLAFRTEQQLYSLSWSDGVYSYTLDAYSAEISKEELIAIAKTIN